MLPDHSNRPDLQHWMVIGLGNSGARYQHDRHNVGYMVVDHLSDPCGAWAPVPVKHRWWSPRTRPSVHASSITHPNRQVTLGLAGGVSINGSGLPVRQILMHNQVPVHRLVVIHDDMDIPFGRVRLSLSGSSGHNGVRDITAVLGDPGYYRVRVGIGRPEIPGGVIPHVLSGFKPAEASCLPQVITAAGDAVRDLVVDGLTSAQSAWHGVSVLAGDGPLARR